MTETPRSTATSWRFHVTRVATSPLVLCVAAFLWLEEWLWDPLANAMQALGQLPILRSIEAKIRCAPPWAAVTFYALPIVVLLPFKFVGLWLLTHDQSIFGIVVFFGAKLIGTAVAARLFSLTHDSLMELPWFALLYSKFIELRTGMYDRVRHNWIWRLVRLLRWRLQRRLLRLLRPQI